MKKRVVQAGEFEVVDERGAVRLRIGLSNDEDPFFSLLSPDGQVRMRFGLWQRRFGRPGDRRRERQGARHRGAVQRRVRRAWRSATRTGRSGRSSVWRPRPRPTMGMQVKDGELSQVYSLAEQGSPTIGLVRQRRQGPRATGSGRRGVTRCLRMLDRDGDLRAVVGLAADGSPFVQFLDEAKQPTWTMR